MCFNKLSSLCSLVIIGMVFLGSALFAGPLKVVGVTNDFASIAKYIGGDNVRVDSLVKGSKNLHDILAKPSMVIKLREADMLIRLGMSQDSWVDGLIQVARNPNLFKNAKGYVDASRYIAKLEVPTSSVDASQGDVHLEGNPHYWLSPSNGRIIAQQIRDALIRLDPKHKAEYEENYLRFEQNLRKKQAEWRSKLAAFKTAGFFTYHKVWSYFFDEFSLTGLGELERLPGIPPSTRHLAELREQASRHQGTVYVVMAPYYNQSLGRSFAGAISAKFLVVPTNASEKTDSGYFDLFDRIIGEMTTFD